MVIGKGDGERIECGLMKDVECNGREGMRARALMFNESTEGTVLYQYVRLECLDHAD